MKALKARASSRVPKAWLRYQVGHGGYSSGRQAQALALVQAETDFVEQRFGAGEHPGGLHFRDVAGAAEIVDAQAGGKARSPPASSPGR